MAEEIEKSMQELDWAKLTSRSFTPSPDAWEDQVLYFLLLDRFSDGRENGRHLDNEDHPVTTGATPPGAAEDVGGVPYDVWFSAGQGWQGGTLKGLQSKLGYLRRMGVTALWVSPVFKQAAFADSYHGYGIQNFLAVDPHFGTRQDLRDLVDAAHAQGIYVILDVILNHAGNVFTYDPDRYAFRDPATGKKGFDSRWDGKPYAVKGLNDKHGQPTIPFDSKDPAVLAAAWPDGAVWPVELQSVNTFTRKGRIVNWDASPEYVEGDFHELKDIYLGDGSDPNEFKPSEALLVLCRAYMFWIAFADVDGFRIDTVKHMDVGATRFFCQYVREFAQSIGKERFLLVGEVTGPRSQAFQTAELTGLDAALGIMDVPTKLEAMIKGQVDPSEYFNLFRNSSLIHRGSHTWFRNKVVTMFDDHDKVAQGRRKGRFCTDPPSRDLIFNALALDLTTMGIPCIYYGSEQRFDSGGRLAEDDRVLRESMFGGRFGAFRTRDRHYFNEETPLFQALARLNALRKQSLLLRRGRQYLQEISGNGQDFGPPRVVGGQMRAIIPWSRAFTNQEILLAINTDERNAQTMYVTLLPYKLPHLVGNEMRCVFSHAPGPHDPPPPTRVETKAGRKVVRLTVPPAGFVIYA